MAKCNNNCANCANATIDSTTGKVYCCNVSAWRIALISLFGLPRVSPKHKCAKFELCNLRSGKER